MDSYGGRLYEREPSLAQVFYGVDIHAQAQNLQGYPNEEDTGAPEKL
jgi:hypothetical protein